MKREQIMQAIKELAKGQGFYQRIYNALFRLRMEQPRKYESVMTKLEEQNFKDTVDLVLYFEC